MKVYLVNRVDTGEYTTTEILKAFSTLEKAQVYVVELNDIWKDSLSFQYKYFCFEIEELEVDCE